MGNKQHGKTKLFLQKPLGSEILLNRVREIFDSDPAARRSGDDHFA
jgi:predicted nucleotidyltransferase